MASNYRRHPTPDEVNDLAGDWASALAEEAAMNERHKFEANAANRKQMAAWKKLQQGLRIQDCQCDECRGLVPKTNTVEG